MTTFLIDSNTIADFLSRQEKTLNRIKNALAQSDMFALCRPVHYEVLRGLLWRDAFAKRNQFDRSIGLFFAWIEFTDEDWVQAARLYAATRNAGKQLADTDRLLAALAYRLEVTIISSDKDFDVLPIKRVSWRTP